MKEEVYSSVELRPPEIIEGKFLYLRGKRVMLDKDLADLYSVKSIALRQQVRRNIDRFPDDFMVSQSVIPSKKLYRGHASMAFTQVGVAMLSGVLRNKKAIEVNIEIMRAFVRLREIMTSHTQLAQKLFELEQQYDAQFKEIFDVIKGLMHNASDEEHDRIIGFKVSPPNSKK